MWLVVLSARPLHSHYNTAPVTHYFWESAASEVLLAEDVGCCIKAQVDTTANLLDRRTYSVMCPNFTLSYIKRSNYKLFYALCSPTALLSTGLQYTEKKEAGRHYVSYGKRKLKISRK